MDASDFHDCDGTCDRQGRTCEQVEANERTCVVLFWIGVAFLAAIVALWLVAPGGSS